MTAARIRRLAKVAAKPERRIIGLMSGTSLDGLDIALCRIAGAGEQTRAHIEHFTTTPYDAATQERVREIAFRPDAPLAAVCALNANFAEVHARMVHKALSVWGVAPAAVDLLASHGQTVFHAPRFRATLQLVDADHLAVRTGLLTVSDFRQKELAAGGEGAPLAPYAESLLYRGDMPRVLLNVGGIANFTWLPPRGDLTVLRFADTGPGNTLIDRAVRRYWPDRSDAFDRDGALAADGRVHAALLARLKEHPYFARRGAKSTGPEEFSAACLDEALATVEGGGALSGVDVVATLTRLTAETVADCLRAEIEALEQAELVVSGGGRHNATLLRHLGEVLPGVRIVDSAALGVPPDAKEALLFAVLANETVAGPGFPAQDGSGRRIGFGKISFPD